MSGGAAQALLDGLGIIESATPHAFDALEKTKKNYKQAGQDAKARGEAKDAPGSVIPGIDEAWIEGYEEMAGAGEGYLELQQVLNKHANDNSNATMAEFSVTQDQAIREFFLGRTDAYTRGALPGAISLQKEYQREFIQKQQAEFELDKLTKSRSLVDANLTQIIKSEPENLAVTVRTEINHAHERGKALGLSKLQVSNQFVNLMGERAFDSANPDMMKFAYEKGPEGIRLIDNPKLAPKIRQFQEQAARERDRRQSERVKNAENVSKDVKTNALVRLTEMINFAGQPGGDPAERNEMLKQFDKELNKAVAQGHLSKTEADWFRDEQSAIHGPDGLFAETDNVDVKVQALIKAQEQPNEITAEYLNSIKPLLTRGSYEQVVKQLTSTWERRKTQAHRESPAEKHFKEQKKVYGSMVNRKNPYTGHALYDKGDEREAVFNTVLVKIMAKEKEYPNPDRMVEILEYAKEKAYEAIPNKVTPSGKPQEVLQAGNGAMLGPSVTPQVDRQKSILSDLDDIDATQSEIDNASPRDELDGDDD
jgi:hypothetical protein